MNILILGRTQILYDTIDNLLEAGHRIVGIITAKAAPEYTRTEEDFAAKAEEIGCPFFCDSRLELIINTLKKPIDIGISINWPTVIHKNVTDLFKLGILNAHCGDLPRYRGNACPNWAIINGEKKIGVSIHFMEPGAIDSGPIVVKEYIDCNSEITISDIYKITDSIIPDMFVRAVNLLSEDSQCVTLQDEEPQKSLRCYPRIPSDSYIDWNCTTIEIDRLIRASCWPFKGAYTYCNGLKIYILHTQIEYFNSPVCVCPGQVVGIDKDNHVVKVACSNGIVCVDSITLEDGEVVNPETVIKSMRYRLGYSVPDKLFELEKRIKELENIIKTGL